MERIRRQADARPTRSPAHLEYLFRQRLDGGRGEPDMACKQKQLDYLGLLRANGRQPV